MLSGLRDFLRECLSRVLLFLVFATGCFFALEKKRLPLGAPASAKKGACPILESFYHNSSIIVGCELIFPRSLVVRINRVQAVTSNRQIPREENLHLSCSCVHWIRIVGLNDNDGEVCTF